MRRAVIVSLIFAMLGSGAAGAELTVRLDEQARELEIEVRGLGAGEHELRVVTPGLVNVETGAEVGEPGIIYLPPASGPVRLDQKVPVEGAENVFFFHSLAPNAGERWELVARFEAGASALAGGTWKLNGRFSPRGGPLTEELVLPIEALEPGENVLHLRHERPPRPVLYYRRAITDGGREVVRERVGVASSVWRGEVRLQRRGERLEVEPLARADVKASERAPREAVVPERWWEDRAGVRGAALAAGRNVLGAQVRDERSFFHGGFQLVYDTRHAGYRMPHWIWAWGPAIAFLLELEKLPGASAAERARWKEAAVAAGRKSLEFGMEEPGHPARGVTTVRWEPSRGVPGGWVEYISTADALFLAGWGWMPLHAATGERVYLERTQRLVAAAERLMKEYPVVPQDWVVQRNRWTPHTLDESVFGMIGFRELHATTRDPKVAAAGRRFLDSHLVEMAREDGILERAWLREEDRAIWDPDIKGHAWVVEGYLDAHALSGEAKYLELARNLTARVLENQAEDGAWAFLFKKPAAGEPRDDKGTAIWAYMLYQLYKKTGDAGHLAAARRAAGWCLRQQYRGEHAELDGAILNTNSMAYVRRRPLTILYSTTFLGLALLEELRLSSSVR